MWSVVGEIVSEGKERTRHGPAKVASANEAAPQMGGRGGMRQRADTGGGGVGAMATTTKTGETMTDTAKTRLFAFVSETTTRAKALGMGEKAKAMKEVSSSTAGTYQRLAKSRLDVSSETGGRLMEGVSARSWHTTRAALLHEATKAFVEARKACDVAQRAGDITGAAWQADQARNALVAFETVQTASKPDHRTAKKSARKTLPPSAQWTKQAFDAASEVQKPAVAVLWASGCRPAEIALGVDVKRGKNGVIVLDVPGAKIKADAGQPRRSIAIDSNSEAGKALLQILGNEKQVSISRPAQRIAKDFEDIRRKTGLKVSAYSFRHQFAAEVKTIYGAHTAGAEQIAAAMGHRVTRSQQHYGTKSQAHGGSGVLAVKAALPVKETRNRPALASSPAPATPAKSRPKIVGNAVSIDSTPKP